MKTILLAGVVMLGLLPSAMAYSPGGPVGGGNDSYQAQVIGYGLGGDLNAPKNLGEEYRRVTPEMYYSFDETFEYFGDKGRAAVDGAFDILNALTNVSSYSANLIEFPVSSRNVNYQAQALGLMDMKSVTLGLMMEQVGLADPVRYTWGLHDRLHVGNIPCPVGEEYTVDMRNYEYYTTPETQVQYSPYVNDTLYSYYILEDCAQPNPEAITVPYSVDPLAESYAPVASFISGAIDWGNYYSGLTRDDVAGLRYLLAASNANIELVPADSLQFTWTTNENLQLFPNPTGTNVVGTNGAGYYYYAGDTNVSFGYGDLAAFYGFAKTNGPAALRAAYPGVIINSYSNDYVYATNVTYSYYYAPPPIGSQYGTPSTLAVATNYTTYGLEVFYYQFGNIFTNHIYTNKTYLYTTTVGAPIGSVYGSAVVTNYTITTTNQIGGDFFVWSPFYNSYCIPDFVGAAFLTNIFVTTNLLSGGTNSLTLTTTNNVSGSTNTVSSTSYLVTYFTNYTYKTHPVACTQGTNVVGKYRGMEKMRFVRVGYDPVLGRFWSPVTNDYTRVLIENSQDHLQHFRRIVTEPDFLFAGADLSTTVGDNIIGSGLYGRNLPFIQTYSANLAAGPGIINSPTRILFDKTGPVFFNSYLDVTNGNPYFTDSPAHDITNLVYTTYYLWSSFDGTTNPPVVYPNGTSIENLANQILVQVSPTAVGDGIVGDDYHDVKFTAAGGGFELPFTWSATGLPEGMNVSPTGTLAGMPAQTGKFLFTLQLTDRSGRSVQWKYSLTINENYN